MYCSCILTVNICSVRANKVSMVDTQYINNKMKVQNSRWGRHKFVRYRIIYQVSNRKSFLSASTHTANILVVRNTAIGTSHLSYQFQHKFYHLQSTHQIVQPSVVREPVPQEIYKPDCHNEIPHTVTGPITTMGVTHTVWPCYSASHATTTKD